MADRGEDRPVSDFRTLSDDDRSTITDVAVRRFGIPTSVLARYRFFRSGKKHISLVANDHRLPERPRIASTGVPFIRTQLKHPKLTTAAVLLLGTEAKQNVVQLERDQVEAFVRREDVQIGPEQWQRLTGPGYIIVRCAEYAVGLALLPPEGADDVLKSLFPKRWSPAC